MAQNTLGLDRAVTSLAADSLAPIMTSGACLVGITAAFQTLITSATGSDDKLQVATELRDRFKAWSSNVGAFPDGHSALEDPMRSTADLREAVLMLLCSLLNDVREACTLLNGTEKSSGLDSNTATSSEAGSASAHSHASVPSSAQNLDYDMVVDDMNETLTCLMRLSIPLADQLEAEMPAEGLRTSMDTQFSWELTSQFPHAPIFVVERLAKAASDRQLSLLTTARRAFTTDQTYSDEAILSHILRSVQGILREADESTLAGGECLDNSSISSAESVISGHESSIVCCICHRTVIYSSPSQLRKHYYHDLTPYVCLFPDCPSEGNRYRSRSTWIEHIKSVHGRVWRCCFGCAQIMGSQDGFNKHMSSAHVMNIKPEELVGLADMCEKHMLLDDATRCSICPEVAGSAHARYRHIARHLETIAMLSLEPPASVSQDPRNPQDMASGLSDTLSMTQATSYDRRSDASDLDHASTLATSVDEDESAYTSLADKASGLSLHQSLAFTDTRRHTLNQSFQAPDENTVKSDYAEPQTTSKKRPYSSDSQNEALWAIDPTVTSATRSKTSTVQPKFDSSDNQRESDRAIESTVEQSQTLSADRTSSRDGQLLAPPLSERTASSPKKLRKDNKSSSNSSRLLRTLLLKKPAEQRAQSLSSIPEDVVTHEAPSSQKAQEQNVRSIPVLDKELNRQTQALGNLQAPPEPSCAICGFHGFPECPHEGERLQLALQQAQDRWSGVVMIREWVLNHARDQVLRVFERARRGRYNAYVQYIQTIPYYSLWLYHSGRPPLSPTQLEILHAQLRSADQNLRLGVDTDWRNSVLMYPETLDYYFRLVDVKFPKEKDERVLSPEIGERRIRRDLEVFDKSATKSEKGRS